MGTLRERLDVVRWGDGETGRTGATGTGPILAKHRRAEYRWPVLLLVAATGYHGGEVSRGGFPGMVVTGNQGSRDAR